MHTWFDAQLDQKILNGIYGPNLEYRIIELTPSSKNSILEKPLVANLGVFHISHKCQGLENSTLFTKKLLNF